MRRPAKRTCTSGETESAPICSPVDVPEDKVKREEGWTSPAFTATSLVVSRAPIAADEFEITFFSERSETSVGRPNGPAPVASTGETGGRPNGSAPPVEAGETGGRPNGPATPVEVGGTGGRPNGPAPPREVPDSESSVAPPAVATSESLRAKSAKGRSPEIPGVESAVQGHGCPITWSVRHHQQTCAKLHGSWSHFLHWL